VPISIVLVDDHTLFRAALSHALRDGGFDVIGQAHDAVSCFATVDALRPDLVLLDLRLPGMDGVTVTRELLTRAPAPKVMIVSGYAQQQDVDEAWAAGAHGYACKTNDLEALTDGIRAIAAGDRWLGPGLPTPRPPRRTRKPLSDGPLAMLSARERDVFRLVVRGMTARQIAVALGIGPKTVETHRERILKKLAMHSVVDLVRLAAQHRMLD
jgi:DNA-binding NarL/FixJ family response regulator